MKLKKILKKLPQEQRQQLLDMLAAQQRRIRELNKEWRKEHQSALRKAPSSTADPLERRSQDCQHVTEQCVKTGLDLESKNSAPNGAVTFLSN